MSKPPVNGVGNINADIEDALYLLLEADKFLPEIVDFYVTPKQWNWLAKQVDPQNVLAPLGAIRYYVEGQTFHIKATKKISKVIH